MGNTNDNEHHVKKAAVASANQHRPPPNSQNRVQKQQSTPNNPLCRYCGKHDHSDEKCWRRPASGSSIAATVGSSVYHANKSENHMAKAHDEESNIAQPQNQIEAATEKMKKFVYLAANEKKLFQETEKREES